jgi:hypothetical protein
MFKTKKDKEKFIEEVKPLLEKLKEGGRKE